jgi:plasmid rolling circle replication initiator protein Rep
MITSGTVIDLAEVSNHDEKWCYSKSAADMVSRLLKDNGYEKHSERVCNCADRLTFKQSVNEQGDVRLKLKSVFLCHVRVCPICMICRARAESNRLQEAIKRIESDNPKQRYVMLTLTVRNCLVNNLRETLTHMSKSWQRFINLKAIKKILTGCYRSLEITRAADNSAHPHYHALIAIKASYFSHNYLIQKEWADLWQKSLRADYIPIVDIRVVDGYNKLVSKGENMKSGALEVAKYICKVKHLINEGSKTDGVWICEFFKQITNIRKNNLTGIFREYLSEDEPDEDEILKALVEESEEIDIDADSDLTFLWFRGVKRYKSLLS